MGFRIPDYLFWVYIKSLTMYVVEVILLSKLWSWQDNVIVAKYYWSIPLFFGGEFQPC